MKTLHGRTVYLTSQLWDKVDQQVDRLALKTHGRLAAAGFMWLLTQDDNIVIEMLKIVDEHNKGCRKLNK